MSSNNYMMPVTLQATPCILAGLRADTGLPSPVGSRLPPGRQGFYVREFVQQFDLEEARAVLCLKLCANAPPLRGGPPPVTEQKVGTRSGFTQSTLRPTSSADHNNMFCYLKLPGSPLSGHSSVNTAAQTTTPSSPTPM